ncbi:MAG: putative quinol monooxygenase [Acetobacteraceae bacterium]|nr:putative quinol monooxygenase [Acetobacteraceae bacterium]
MIHVLAIVTAKPGERDTVLAAFRANMPAVHAEEGCVQYEPVVDAPDAGAMQTPLGPDTFCVVERWETMAALQAHGRSAHMKEYGARVKDLLAKRTIHVLTRA